MAGRLRFRVNLDLPQSWSPMPQRSSGELAGDARARRRAEIGQIVAALEEVQPAELRRRELARRVGARKWGPGCFAAALRQATAEGVIRRTGLRAYRLAEPDDA